MKRAIACVALCLLMLVSNVAAVVVSAEDNYADNGVDLAVGTVEYETDTAYEYTVFCFEPTEVGKYTLSCEEQQLGIAGYNWVTVPLSADTVNSDAIEWSCTSVGQSVIIAVESGDGAVVITIVREDLVQKEEIRWTIYENQVTPEKFTFSGDTEALLAVNTADNTVDSAVLGADGFYHLNAANGPILYAKLKDPQMSLATVMEHGGLKNVVQDADNTVLSKTDYNAAVGDYVACADPKTSLYPLTVDLIEVFQCVGEYQNWYGNLGFVGGHLDDAWMFACYYNELPDIPEPSVGDVNLDGKVDLNDATALFYHVNGLTELDEDALAVADLNNDAKVGLDDATALFYIINGLSA